MKNIKTLIMFIVFSTLLFSSVQRVAALGGNAAFWPEDDANIWVFPHTANNWNIANTDGNDFFVMWGDKMKFGFKGGMDADMLNLTWGMGNMGLNFGLGMTPEVTGVTGVTEVTCDDGTTTCDTYVAGVDAVTAADATTTINTNFGMGMGFGDIGLSFNNASGTNIGVVLRRAQNVWIWDNMLVNFNMAAPEVGDAVMSLGCNFFTHINIANNTTGLWAMGFGWTNEGDGDITFPAMTFAVESGMTDWATVRAGFTKDWSVSNTSSAGVDPTFGLGFNYGSFNLDMDVGTDLFTNPVGKMTGFSPVGTGNFNITYTW